MKIFTIRHFNFKLGKMAQLWILSLIFLLLISFLNASAQTKPSANKDEFLLRDMQEIVLLNHPIIQQAGLLSKAAQARVLQSLGNFDPEVMASFGRKIFGGTEYYNHWDSELKVPLWLAGADLNVGYDRNVGVYNNPETRTSSTGLAGVGLSIPLGQGLLIDSRRNTLRQAKIMVGYAEAEKVAQINSVWLGAVKDYWTWYFAAQQLKYMEEGVNLASRRFRALREQVLLGDKPPIDSVEASITLQDRQVQLQQASVELNNSRLVLSNHLWNSQGVPQELPITAMPEQESKTNKMVSTFLLDSLVARAGETHPQILKMRSELAKLGVESKYRREMFKPKLNLKGSFLAGRRDFGFVPDNYDFRLANYKVGIDFSFPLFLREERGKLREIKIQQAEITYGIQQSGREIQTSVITAYNDFKAYQSQLDLQTRNVANQQVLVKGELQKFDLGESNLFLINTRESKLIDMQVKRAELVSSLQKAMAEIYYRAGRQIVY
ncbi:TolC family protein [Pedobacter mucosus]|uniref:TolC family protein n=1 Tax=Pedobacter mucosus TaxID=2895286 RepID=UPI001EE46C64|nr:TolC family protein [Pedobacter mucosus]UKT65224.1 TolC family protein [Pedobacter mucosus]